MTTDPLRPPVKRVRSEISKAAARVERLKLKLRKQGKAVQTTTLELHQAKRFLTSIIEDAAPEAPALAEKVSAFMDKATDVLADIKADEPEGRVFGIGAGGDTGDGEDRISPPRPGDRDPDTLGIIGDRP